MRREVLGLDETPVEKKELSLDIETLDAEKDLPEQTNEISEQERTRKEILNCAIPKLVYKNAINGNLKLKIICFVFI